MPGLPRNVGAPFRSANCAKAESDQKNRRDQRADYQKKRLATSLSMTLPAFESRSSKNAQVRHRATNSILVFRYESIMRASARRLTMPWHVSPQLKCQELVNLARIAMFARAKSQAWASAANSEHCVPGRGRQQLHSRQGHRSEDRIWRIHCHCRPDRLRKVARAHRGDTDALSQASCRQMRARCG